MGIQDELNALFDEGKTITECIEIGYKKSSVYRYNRFYRMEKEKEQLKLLIDESEQIKKVFGAFLEGEKLIEVVRKYGISPPKVKELHENYLELGEIEAGVAEERDRINELLERKRILQAENEVLEANQVKIRASINELYNSYMRLGLVAYIKARDAYLDNILCSKMEGVDYSDEERERALINDVRALLCSKGVRF